MCSDRGRVVSDILSLVNLDLYLLSSNEHVCKKICQNTITSYTSRLVS